MILWEHSNFQSSCVTKLKTYTTVLGIHDGHDSGAAIVQNGKIIAAISEERLRNIKRYAGIPSLSIKEVLKISKLDPSQIDLIAI